MYELITRWALSTPWAILPEKLAAIGAVLSLRAAGERVAPEEIAAVTNGRRNGGGQLVGSVAVLPLYGTIAHRMDMLMESSGGTSTQAFTEQFRGALADNGVSAIVLDVDSPGGAVDGVPELATEIMRARGQKPIVAVANTLAASAAYWIATAADELWVSPSGEVGSIGVWALHEDLSRYYDSQGVTMTLLRAGKHKAETNAYEPLGEEARAYLQSRIDDYYGMFVVAVAQQRGVARETVREGFGQGRVVGAKAAVAQGMAHAEGTLDDAIQRAALLARKAARERARTAELRLRIAGM
jgi:signal peptide peptidase SppA